MTNSQPPTSTNQDNSHNPPQPSTIQKSFTIPHHPSQPSTNLSVVARWWLVLCRLPLLSCVTDIEQCPMSGYAQQGMADGAPQEDDWQDYNSTPHPPFVQGTAFPRYVRHMYCIVLRLVSNLRTSCLGCKRFICLLLTLLVRGCNRTIPLLHH